MGNIMNKLEAVLVLTTLSIPFISLGTICGCGSPLAGGDLLIGYPHKVEGVVVNDPTTRYIRAGDVGAEKVALTIKVENQIPLTLAAGVSGEDLFVECLSTRCTQIEKGESHSLVCRGVGRFLEPNIVQCKHVRKLYE